LIAELCFELQQQLSSEIQHVPGLSSFAMQVRVVWGAEHPQSQMVDFVNIFVIAEASALIVGIHAGSQMMNPRFPPFVFKIVALQMQLLEGPQKANLIWTLSAPIQNFLSGLG
jgi:hypothetical protein